MLLFHRKIQRLTTIERLGIIRLPTNAGYGGKPKT